MHKVAQSLCSADPSPTKSNLSPYAPPYPYLHSPPPGSYPDLRYGRLLLNILTNLQDFPPRRLCKPKHRIVGTI